MYPPTQVASTPRTNVRLALSLPFLLAGLGCALLGVSTSSDFTIREHFPERLGQVEILGLEVRSALPDRTLPDSELRKLSGMLSSELRQTTIGAVVNLNAGNDPEKMSVVMTVDISRFDAATREQRRQRVPSRLEGSIALRSVATQNSLGRADITVTGSNLDLKPTHPPDTVREFAAVIRQIIR